jgi:hypothetical protein
VFDLHHYYAWDGAASGCVGGDGCGYAYGDGCGPVAQGLNGS